MNQHKPYCQMSALNWAATVPPECTCDKPQTDLTQLKLKHEMDREEKYISKSCIHCGGKGLISYLNPAYIRSKRVRAGISLRDMAKKLGFSAPFLSDVEHGKRNPNSKIINYIENL